MQIINDPEYKILPSFRKGLNVGVISSVALGCMSCFHGLTPEQNQAGFVVSVCVLEILRNVLKKRFPRFFSFL